MPCLILSFIWGVIIIIIITAVFFISFIKWQYQYWKRRNIPYLEPSIPFGNVEPLYNLTIHFDIQVKNLYDNIKKRNLKYCGIYTLVSPVLLITDLDLARNILTKDFQYFSNRGFYYNERDDPLSAHLFAISGTKWRNLRTKLTPTFTSGKLRQMFQTLVDCGKVLNDLMQAKYSTNEPINIKDVLSCFTIDVIGSCAFGLDCHTFEDENSPFRVYGRKFFQFKGIRAFLTFIGINYPKFANFLGIRMVEKDVSDFFTKIVTDTINYREKNNVKRKDFLQLLIDIKSKEKFEENDNCQNGNTLNMGEVAAQSFVFFIAGFETSSTLMTFTLYELAKHPDIQEKVRKEIQIVLKKYDEKITYDALNELKYMNQVFDEILRKYPPLGMISRKSVKNYLIPNSTALIEKGTRIFVPIYGIHMDPEYYPDPDRFDPERFTEENKQQRHPYSHIPFGEGPRICIGMRFGIMQSKVGLTTLLKKYKFSINPRTKEPLKMSPISVVFSTEGDIWLNFTELK